MRRRTLSLAFLAIILGGKGLPAPETGGAAETRTFDVSRGDTLVIRNDYGSVRVLAWDQPKIEARLDKNGEGVEIASETEGDRVFLYSFFQGAIPGAVAMDIQAPAFINLVVWGANPEVELSGIAGYVRVQTLAGAIAAQDLTSSASLITEKAGIWLRSRVQPQGDIRLESTAGNILCEISQNLNFRGWTRAGGTLAWSPGFEQQGGQYEQQVGTGGPLIYAASQKGDVRVHFQPAAVRREDRVPTSTDAGPGKQAPPELRTSRPAAEEPPPPAGKTAAKPADPVSVESTSGAGEVTIRVNVDWVYLNVSVRDRTSNRSIPDLRREDFLVYEDGTLQDVQQFESAEAPFNLLLLLDVSGSTQGFFRFIQKAAVDFTREIKANDRIAVATFNSRPRLIQGFTNDRGAVAEAISRMRSGGGTAFYDALDTCVEDYLRGIEGRTAIVIFSDGVDNQLTGNSIEGSNTEFDELFQKIQEIDPIIYTIFLDTEKRSVFPSGQSGGGTVGQIIIDILSGGKIPSGRPRQRPGANSDHEAYRIAREQMQMIADQTGGRMYSPYRIEDLSGAYSEIAEDLRIQYRLGYNSANRTSQRAWHAINVKIDNHPDALARTRKGYYSKPGRPANAANP